MYQQTATGNNAPDSGSLLPNNGNNKALTIIDAIPNSDKLPNTGNETSETGTANSLLNHCESTDKSTALHSDSESSINTYKNKDEAPVKEPENPSINHELAAAITAINNLPLSAEEKAAIIRQLYSRKE